MLAMNSRVPTSPAASTPLSTLSAAEFLQTGANHSGPVMIRDAAAAWPALHRWTLASLQTRIGERPALAVRRPVSYGGRELSIGALLQLLEDDPDAPVGYLHGASIPLLYPELITDLQPLLAVTQPNRMSYTPVPKDPQHERISRLGFPELIVGGRGKGIGTLHFDVGHEHAFITQIIGAKEFLLFAPEHSACLYPAPRQPNQSQVPDIWNADHARFPLLADAPQIRATVPAGTTLFIPAGWWHSSRGLEPTVAVSFNSVTRGNWRRFMNYRVSQQPPGLRRRLLSLRLRALGHVLDLRETLGLLPTRSVWS